MLLQFLPISTLNIADDSFRITFAPKIDQLAASIKSVDVVQPIIVRHTVDGAYQIIAGYRRVLACQCLARQTIPALIFEHGDLSVQQAFLMNLHDNLATRQLNVVEMAIAHEKLAHTFGMPEDDLVKKYLPLMGEEPSYKVLHQLLAINQCSTAMKELIVERSFAISTAARIGEFSPTTQQELIGVLKPLRATTAKLNDLLTLIREIAARDALSVEEVLQRYQLLTVVANPSVTPQEKLSALRQTLRGVRFPVLAQKQEQFAGLLSELCLPQSAKLRADPYFEDRRMKLECSFKEPQELKLLVERLQNAFEKQAWHKIFDWYRD